MGRVLSLSGRTHDTSVGQGCLRSFRPAMACSLCKLQNPHPQERFAAASPVRAESTKARQQAAYEACGAVRGCGGAGLSVLWGKGFSGGRAVTELVFKGKEFVWNHHLAVPFRPLVMQPDMGIGDPRLDCNLIVHGDSLHTLKALL